MRTRKLLVGLFTAAVVFAIAGAASASAAPVWNLSIHHSPTNFPRGGSASYSFVVFNAGDTTAEETINLTVDLPAGLTVESVRLIGGDSLPWDCAWAPGGTSVSCSSPPPLKPGSFAWGPVLNVAVAADAPAEVVTTATVSGGGAAVSTTETERAPISSDPAPFGIVPGSFLADFFEQDGLTPVRQAGAHPAKASFAFDFNTARFPLGATAAEQNTTPEHIRDLQVVLPPGFLGNPTAVGECLPAQLLDGTCPPNSLVGRLDATLYPLKPSPEQPFFAIHAGMYNMTHPRGVITDLATSAASQPLHIKVSLDPANHYAIKTTVTNINESYAIFDQKLTLWGVPARSTHAWEHCTTFSQVINQPESGPCPVNEPEKAYLTAPFECGVENTMRLSNYDSWSHPGVFGPEVQYRQPGPVTGCDKPRFEPDVSVHPTSEAANSPTGLDVHIKVPQNENPNGLATPPVKRFRVAFPEGMTVSPSFADGLGGCSLGQIKLGTNDAVDCPPASRIGTVQLSTPLLPDPLQGSMYLSVQKENPLGATFGMYLVLHDTEERGVLLKMPGRLDLDPVTGQVTSVFNDLPQFPFDDLTLEFRSGARAPLVNPPSCGKQTIGVEVASWSQPDKPVDAGNTFDVTQGPLGTPCPAGLGARPFAPKMSAGVTNPTAGAYSPFVFRLTRQDSDQDLSRIGTTLPKGLFARIADISTCPDAAIASISGEEGSARAESENPACPASSQIGTVTVGMGAGTGPNYFPGKVYLGGPYKGAPLSLAVVIPALVGPFDFGTVVVRAAVRVDPETTQISVLSDEVPTILHGILLRVRDVRINVDRPHSMLNPTSCEPTKVLGRMTSTNGADALLSSRFQVSSCASLGFKPRLSLRLEGGTNRGDYPALTATLRPRPGDANISRTAVTLPHSEFLAQEHIRTVCTRVQFAADRCPKGSIYGTARAISPLMNEPLEGPVYLRSSDNPLPDLVAALHGRVDVNVVGRIDSVDGGIRTTFPSIPDAAVSKFTLKMKGGKKSLLVNSRNLCLRPGKADIRMAAHNGRRALSHPVVKSGCKKKTRR